MSSRERVTGRLGARSALPRGRAVVGGLLIAATAVGVLLAHDAAVSTDRRQWLVATQPIAVGQRIEPEALGFASMDLPAATSARAFSDGDAVVGKVAAQPIAPGELLQRSAVGRSRSDGPARRLTLAVTSAQALGGDLRSGDRVDVVAASRDSAAVIARDAMVRSISAPERGLGGAGKVSLTIVVADEATAADVLAAAARDEVALIAASEATE